jgi:FtsH-binding integral membrane protein
MDLNFSQQTQELSNERAKFISSVWAYFGLAIGMATIGAWAGEIIISSLGFFIPYIAFIALMLTQGFWATNKNIAAPLFILFAFISGTILYPTLAYASMTGQIGAVIQALLASSGLFFAAAIWGYTTKKDLSGMGQFLFFTMIGVFIAGVVNIFLGNSLLDLIISGIAVVLFSAYTAYDIQAIKNGLYDSAIMAALHLYINMFALFSNLLNIFLSTNDN